MKKLAVVDRDGTLIKDPYGYFPHGVENWREKLEFHERVFEGLRLLQENGVYIAVVSNQAGVARGLITKIDVESVNYAINQSLTLAGLEPLQFFYCPYVSRSYAIEHLIPLDNPYVNDELAKRRKPNTGMIEEARRYYNLHDPIIFVVGDKADDVFTALNVGGVGILVKTGEYEKYLQEVSNLTNNRNCFIAENFYEACKIIVEYK